MKSAEEDMDLIAAYQEVGTYRGAAVMCGCDHKTVRRAVARHRAGAAARQRPARGHNYNEVAELVAARSDATNGRISAKRLLPQAKAAGYTGSVGLEGEAGDGCRKARATTKYIRIPSGRPTSRVSGPVRWR
ncbi:MAG TPA: hypothetical protein VFW71_10150 [Actinomycetota bacterium]|nr:hypothetical protein [Actinomycetota bacterium]